MLRLFGRKEDSVLDDPIEMVLQKMETAGPESSEYPVYLSELEVLVRLKRDEKSNRISPDTMAIVLGNLLGILIIVGYEHGHVFGSRAQNFILRTKHQ